MISDYPQPAMEKKKGKVKKHKNETEMKKTLAKINETRASLVA